MDYPFFSPITALWQLWEKLFFKNYSLPVFFHIMRVLVDISQNEFIEELKKANEDENVH
jgi:hypothetical protein